MLRLLSRMFPLALCLSLFASSAMALPVQYDLTGSLMSMINTGAGGSCNPCTVSVTGSVILDDDGVGNVTVTNLFLSHDPYEVGNPVLISVIIDRDAVTLGGADPVGAGTTVGGNTVFGATVLGQTGTTNCTPVLFPCVLAGLPTGISPLTRSVPVDLGTWAFDLLGDFASGPILYTNQAGATETLTLVGTTMVPEPGTMLLVGAGVLGLALRRRAGF